MVGHTKYSKQQKWPKRREQSTSKDQSSGATKDFLSRTCSGIQNLLIYPADKVLKRCRTRQMSPKGGNANVVGKFNQEDFACAGQKVLGHAYHAAAA